jgi:hypothetical protein
VTKRSRERRAARKEKRRGMEGIDKKKPTEWWASSSTRVVGASPARQLDREHALYPKNKSETII